MTTTAHPARTQRPRTARIVMRGSVAAVLRHDRPVWACQGTHGQGAALALLAAVRYCRERGWTVVGAEVRAVSGVDHAA